MRFRDLISHTLGLQFDDARLGFLAEVLRRRLEASGQRSDRYLARLASRVSTDDVAALAQELTVGETYFFRHIEQYRAFTGIALPDRVRSAQTAGVRLQILSAGCASGEEPYSLAIAVQDAGADRSAGVAILGVDVNAAVLERAGRGRFSAWVLRDTPLDVQRRWFRPEGREFVLNDAARNAVRFAACNLADEHLDLWQPESQDIVFCRNMLMYFTPAKARALVRRLTVMLRPGGYLFLGHAETLRGLSNDFHLRHTHGTFYYQRRDHVSLGGDQDMAASSSPDRPILQSDPIDVSWVETIRRASERVETLVNNQDQSRSSLPPATPKPGRAWEIGLALELLRKERFAEALVLMDAYPAESGWDADVLLLRAVLLAHSGQFVEAERACERLLGLDELSAGAHYLLALCREGVGDRSGARYHDQVAVYLDPGFAMAHLHLGVLGRRTEDSVTARREFEQAILLLEREDTSRLLLFGGGFSREALVALCRAELLGSGGRP
ncbi:MAG: CheR family methyltransferase [Vicinamibacterales bacterium]